MNEASSGEQTDESVSVFLHLSDRIPVNEPHGSFRLPPVREQLAERTTDLEQSSRARVGVGATKGPGVALNKGETQKAASKIRRQDE